MVVRAVWKEVLLWALEEGGMGLRFVLCVVGKMVVVMCGCVVWGAVFMW
jgi:hypothetical protein